MDLNHSRQMHEWLDQWLDVDGSQSQQIRMSTGSQSQQMWMGTQMKKKKKGDLLAGRAVTRVDHEEVGRHTTPLPPRKEPHLLGQRFPSGRTGIMSLLSLPPSATFRRGGGNGVKKKKKGFPHPPKGGGWVLSRLIMPVRLDWEPLAEKR